MANLYLFLCPPPDKSRPRHRCNELSTARSNSHRSILLQKFILHSRSEITHRTRCRGNGLSRAGKERGGETLARHSLVSRDHKLGNLRAPPGPGHDSKALFPRPETVSCRSVFPVAHRYCCRGSDTTRTFYPDPFYPPRNNLWLLPRNSSRRDRRKPWSQVFDRWKRCLLWENSNWCRILWLTERLSRIKIWLTGIELFKSIYFQTYFLIGQKSVQKWINVISNIYNVNKVTLYRIMYDQNESPCSLLICNKSSVSFRCCTTYPRL